MPFGPKSSQDHQMLTWNAWRSVRIENRPQIGLKIDAKWSKTAPRSLQELAGCVLDPPMGLHTSALELLGEALGGQVDIFVFFHRFLGSKMSGFDSQVGIKNWSKLQFKLYSFSRPILEAFSTGFWMQSKRISQELSRQSWHMFEESGLLKNTAKYIWKWTFWHIAWIMGRSICLWNFRKSGYANEHQSESRFCIDLRIILEVVLDPKTMRWSWQLSVVLEAATWRRYG